MKPLFTSLILLMSVIGKGQTAKADGYKAYNGAIILPNGSVDDSSSYLISDSLTAERHIKDSLGNWYMVEYRYGDLDIIIQHDSLKFNHRHHIANCSIVSYKGNKTKIIADNIKAIYSPTNCEADNDKLWLKRLYELKNK